MGIFCFCKNCAKLRGCAYMLQMLRSILSVFLFFAAVNNTQSISPLFNKSYNVMLFNSQNLALVL